MTISLTCVFQTSRDHLPDSRFVRTLDGHGQFSKFHVCFCGLDPGNLKFGTVRTNKQHICF